MSALGEVETALRNSDLGVNPTNNGDNLRVVLPSLTEERRKEYIKLARTKAEDGKVAVRGSRGNAKKAIEKLVKDKEIGEDEGTRRSEERRVGKESRGRWRRRRVREGNR